MTLARARTAALAAALLCFATGGAQAYPLDGTDETGIPRLDAYDRANRGENLGKLVPLGAMLRMNKITLRLLDRPGFTLPAPDAELSRAIESMLAGDAARYGLAPSASGPARKLARSWASSSAAA